MSGATPDGAEAAVYRVGTLSYTRKTLFVLFAWLLIGDFCFQLLETVVPKLLPLQLKSHGADNWLIGLLVGTVPAAMVFTLNPIISVWSDRFRSPFGRRIPFLIVPAPFVLVTLGLLAYADPLAAWVSTTFPFIPLNEAQSALVVLGAASVAFQFFNLFDAAVFYYLINDVVPKAFMGRFYGLFRIVASVKGVVFNWYHCCPK